MVVVNDKTFTRLEAIECLKDGKMFQSWFNFGNVDDGFLSCLHEFNFFREIRIFIAKIGRVFQIKVFRYFFAVKNINELNSFIKKPSGIKLLHSFLCE